MTATFSLGTMSCCVNGHHRISPSLVRRASQLGDPRVVPSHQPPEQRVERLGALVHPLEYLLAAARGRAAADDPSLGDPREPKRGTPVVRVWRISAIAGVTQARAAVRDDDGDDVVPRIDSTSSDASVVDIPP